MIVGSGNAVVNRVIAAYLPIGSIASLAYAEKLVQIPSLIFSGSVITALYPFFADHAADKQIEEAKNTFALSIRMSGFIFIPLAVSMIILSKPVIQVVFERGAFGSAAPDIISKIFICYAFQIFISYAVAIMVWLLAALQDFSSILKVSVIGFVLNILLNLFLVNVVEPPVAGIAISSSIGCFVQTVLYFWYLKKKIANVHGILIVKSLSKILAIALISGIVIREAHGILVNMMSCSLLGQITNITVSTLSGAAVFLGIALLTKLEEAEKVFNLVKNKLHSNL